MSGYFSLSFLYTNFKSHPIKWCIQLVYKSIAFGVYEASCELGIKVGRDLLVTGFGDLPFAQRLSPPLTTIQVEYEKLGYQAAWLLYQQITGKISVPTRLSISTKLQKRSSC